MKKILLIILLQLFAVQAYLQDNIILEGPLKDTERSVLEYDYIKVGNNYIYQAAQNESRCTDNNAGESCKSKYFYYVLPQPKILDLRVINDSTVRIKIDPNIPNNIDLVEALKTSELNRYANIAHIRPIEIVRYRVLYEGEILGEVDTQGGIDGLRRVDIECDNPKQVAKDIKDGWGALSIEVWYVIKHKRTIEFQVTAQDIIKSEYFREIFSPVEGNEISAFHLELATRAVTSELISKFRINGKVDPIAYENYQDMKDIIYEHVREYIASTFKQGIENGMLDMQQRAIDLSEDRYATDYTTRVIYDAQNMESEEFINTVHEEERERKKIATMRSGSGAMEIMKFFKVGAEGKSGKRLNEEWHKLYTTEDKGKKLIQDSVNYEEEGKKFYPKSINIYEVISSDWNFNSDYKHISISYDQSVVPREIQLE